MTKFLKVLDDTNKENVLMLFVNAQEVIPKDGVIYNLIKNLRGVYE